VLARFLQFLFVLFLIRMFFRAAHALMKTRSPSPPDRTGAQDLVRDPVCQTFVPRPHAVREVVGGEERFFCSSTCAQHALSAKRSILT
jgi:YHS domain-containing protein